MSGKSIVGEVVAYLSVDDRKFTAGMGHAQKQFSSFHSDLESKGKQITGILAGAFSTAAVYNFAKECVTAFAEEQAALVALGTVVNATGANWGEYITATQEAMVAGEQLGFKGHETANALKTLTLMTGDAAKGYKLLALAQDLARAKGMDLASASSLIAKVEEGRIGIASRILPFLKAGMSAEEALAAIEERVAGSSLAHAKTTQGQIEMMSASWEGFKETLGGSVAPAVVQALGEMSDAVNKLSSGDWNGSLRDVAFGADSANYMEAAVAAGDYGSALKELFRLGTPPEITPEIAAKMRELGSATAATSTYVADATSMVSRFGNSAQNAASETQDLADTFSLLKAEISDSRTTAEGYTDAVLAEQAATKKLDDDRKNGAGRAQVMQDEQKLGDAHKQTAVSLGQLVEEYQYLTPAEIKAAVKSHELTKQQGDLFIAAHNSGKEVGVLSGKLAELPSKKKVVITVDDSQVEAWLKHFSAISKSLNIHVYGSGTVVKPSSQIKKAAGDIISPFGGGQQVTVAENGYRETLINWSPANASRNAGLLATTAAGLGMSGQEAAPVVNYYITNQVTANVSNDYDVERLAERLQRLQSTRARAMGKGA